MRGVEVFLLVVSSQELGSLEWYSRHWFRLDWDRDICSMWIACIGKWIAWSVGNMSGILTDSYTY